MIAHVVVAVVSVCGLAWCVWACCVIVREEVRARRAGERAEVILNREFWDDRLDG